MAEILDKIPAGTKWAITSNVLASALVVRGEKVIAPVLGKLKWLEINNEVYGEGGKLMFPQIKEEFKFPVRDATEAATFAMLALMLLMGPETQSELIEATPERAVVRTTKCPFWERYEENEVNPELIPCEIGHQAFCKEGFKAITPNVTYKLVKARPSGESYCEGVYEFKEK